MITLEKPYDIVLTTNSGYPLDQNLYQCVKGMSAAGRIVREGGAIVMAARCEDGIPAHGGYAELLRKAGSPQGILDMLAQPGFSSHDQWQVQIQAGIQKRADVYVFSEGLSEDQIREALFIPCRDLVDTLAKLRLEYGPRLCILPEGPQTIPTLG